MLIGRILFAALGTRVVTRQIILAATVKIMKTAMPCGEIGVVLTSEQSLKGVRKERHAKRRSDRDVAYLVVDRLGEWTLLGQKLPLLTAWINEHAAGAECDRVSVNGLWSNLDRSDGRVGGWHKGRWRINAVDLERASDAFESKRASSAKAALIAGEPSCYAL